MRRQALPDVLRGFSLCSMILYHALWDLVYLAGVDLPWYRGAAGFLWQQSICWCFILVSGFCRGMSRRPLYHGLRLLACGALIRAATAAVLPEAPIRFGVLTLLGMSALLCEALEPLLRRVPPAASLALFAFLFAACYRVPEGTFAGLALPRALYRNELTALLGFPPAGFVSSDYFPLLPWTLLFCCGASLGHLLRGKTPRFPAVQPFAWLGRHSLAVYLLHQPLLYAAFWLAGMIR